MRGEQYALCDPTVVFTPSAPLLMFRLLSLIFFSFFFVSNLRNNHLHVHRRHHRRACHCLRAHAAHPRNEDHLETNGVIVNQRPVMYVNDQMCEGCAKYTRSVEKLNMRGDNAKEACVGDIGGLGLNTRYVEVSLLLLRFVADFVATMDKKLRGLLPRAQVGRHYSPRTHLAHAYPVVNPVLL